MDSIVSVALISKTSIIMGVFKSQKTTSMIFSIERCAKNLFFTGGCASILWTVFSTQVRGAKPMFGLFVKNF